MKTRPKAKARVFRRQANLRMSDLELMVAFNIGLSRRGKGDRRPDTVVLSRTPVRIVQHKDGTRVPIYAGRDRGTVKKLEAAAVRRAMGRWDGYG